jgi:chromosome segregation ATPase
MKDMTEIRHDANMERGCAVNLSAISWQAHVVNMVENFDEIEKKLIEANHRCTDLQQVCDDQDKQITTLTDRIKRQGKVINDLQKGNCPCRVEKMEQIATLKSSHLNDRAELILCSPSYSVWRYQHDIDRVDSSEDWKPIKEKAREELAKEMPEIDWSDVE